MSKPDAPQPPNPYQTAAAQTGTNVSTAIANSYLNNINQNTPDGSVSYDQTGTYEMTDPTSGQKYNVPRWTANQTLSAAGQQLKDTTNQTKQSLAQTGLAASNKIGGILNTDFNASGLPQGGDSSTISNIPKALTSFDPGGPVQMSLGDTGQIRSSLGPTGQNIQTTFGDAGDITRSYGPQDNFSSDRQRVEDSLMQRMNPQLQIEQQRIQQQLADQGIRYGSQAYNDAMRVNSMQANDARYGAIAQAGSEQQRMMDMAAQRAGFQNAAQQQSYNQEQGRGTFANAAQGQMFSQNASDAAFQNAAQQQGFTQELGRGTFGNAAQNQLFTQNAAEAAFANSGLAQQVGQAQSGFNAAEAQRNQALQEGFAFRNQPLNEINALMSGSQVSQPNFVNAPSTQIPTTDYAGITQQGFQNQMGIYGQQNANYNSTMGGLLGLGAGALKLSDVREKEDISRVGTIFSSNEAGEKDALPTYEYSYKGDPSSTRHIGPMAQDVERHDPKAVVNSGGRKFIKTQRLMGNILRAA